MKFNNLLISVLLSVGMVGCGGGSESLDAGTTPQAVQRTLSGGTESSVQTDAQQTSVVSIAGYRGNYTIVKDQATNVVTATSKIDNSVATYQNPSLIKFVDKWVSFDIDGAAGQVYRLYQAAFNRKPDLPGLGFWIYHNANGRAIIDIASDFVVSAEFKTMYGDKPANLKLVNAFYNNVLRRDGEQAGLDWWVGQMNNGAATYGVLYGFSDSAENKNNLAADMQNGFDYVPFQPGGQVIPKATSYENAKTAYPSPLTLPAEEVWAAAYARADFKGDGSTTLFSAHRTYDNTKPISEATPGVMGFWSQAADGTWVKEPGMIDSTVSCIEPRKAVVADFNSDGKADILIACTGYDNGDFPGEQLMMVESNVSGVYHAHVVEDFVGFFHGAAAADLDGDGLIDFITTDNNPVHPLRMFKNKGNGRFVEVKNAFPSSTARGGYFTLELVDVNNDGKLDLLLGGHEYEGTPTTILYGDGTPLFVNATVVKLPATSATTGIVLDFVVEGDTLFIGRTNGGESGFYTKLALQKVDLKSNSNLSLSERDGDLFIWLIPDMKGSVISDRTDRPLRF